MCTPPVSYTHLDVYKRQPMGDPMELRIHGYELTLRLDDAAQITVTPTEKTPAVHAPVAEKLVEHPGLREGGKMCIRDSRSRLTAASTPSGTMPSTI